MPFELIEQVISETAPYGLKEVIPSTMGEPLLYRYFDKIVDLLKLYEIKMNLTTNGTFPGIGAKAWGEKLLPIISDVKISINAVSRYTSNKIMKGLDYDEYIEGIRRFIQVRDGIKNSGGNEASITFQITYLESNLLELPELVTLAIELGIDRIKGHHLWITWPQLKNESLTRSCDSRKRWNKTLVEIRNIAERYPLKSGEKIKIDNAYLLPIEKNNTSLPADWLCPFLGKEAWIAWDGTFNVCCSPDKQRRTLGYYGNVNEAKFLDLWKSSEYTTLFDNWGKYKVCNSCNMRRPPQSSDIDLRGE
jgi:MoaA/NifB/PqqE/SkfB family radical SAM enzyme